MINFLPLKRRGLLEGGGLIEDLRYDLTHSSVKLLKPFILSDSFLLKLSGIRLFGSQAMRKDQEFKLDEHNFLSDKKF